MKHNLENIPEVSIDKVDAFYVTGTQHRDAAGKTNNLKLNLKNSASSGSLIDTISKMSGAERKALKAALDAPDANGHEYVDLGLPSGTLWATKYVGQDEQHPTGALFAWGDPVAIADPDNYASSDYKYWNDDNTGFTKYNQSDGKTTLDLEDDAAHVNMGGDWRMPSADQIQELIDYCEVSVNIDNNLVVFASKVNANELIVPYNNYDGNVGGEYEFWSRNIYSNNGNFYRDRASELLGYVTEQGVTDIAVDCLNRPEVCNVWGVLQDSDSDSEKQCDCVPTIEVVGYNVSSWNTLKEGSSLNHSNAEMELGPIFYGIFCGKFPAIKVHLVDDDLTYTLTKFVPANLDNEMYDGDYVSPKYVMLHTEPECFSGEVFCSEVRFAGGSGGYNISAYIKRYPQHS